MQIIESLLDLDFYKPTMGQMVLHRQPDISVFYGFINRTTSVNLLDHIVLEELAEQLDAVMDLSVTPQEIAFLSQQGGLFKPDYLDFMKTLKLPDYELGVKNNLLSVGFPGKWKNGIYWETLDLSIKSEMYCNSLCKNMSDQEYQRLLREGLIRLDEKIAILKKYPEIKIIEFGTRRRFSRAWQRTVVERLAEKIPDQLLGTSNVRLAMDLGLKPIGTWAHELPMVYSGIYHDSEADIRGSHNKVIQDWWDEYGYDLSISLTDTFGTDFFFLDMTPEQAAKGKGLRHDSGDPIVFGEKAIANYKRHGVDPLEKLLVFSDGLDIQTIVKIYLHFRGRINVAFGWGTNLTNDLGLKTLSLVVKAIMANGNGTVKLSDNLAKALGALKDIDLFKRAFGYTNTFQESCTY